MQAFSYRYTVLYAHDWHTFSGVRCAHYKNLTKNLLFSPIYYIYIIILCILPGKSAFHSLLFDNLSLIMHTYIMYDAISNSNFTFNSFLSFLKENEFRVTTTFQIGYYQYRFVKYLLKSKMDGICHVDWFYILYFCDCT